MITADGFVPLETATTTIDVSDVIPDDDMFTTMSDRGLLEYIARNMLTPDRVLSTVKDSVPGIVEDIRERMENDPKLRTFTKLLKMMP